MPISYRYYTCQALCSHTADTLYLMVTVEDLAQKAALNRPKTVDFDMIIDF